MGIREREAKSIAERKKHLVSILADVATVGAERMSEKIGKAGLRECSDRNRDRRGQDARVDGANTVVADSQPCDADGAGARGASVGARSSGRYPRASSWSPNSAVVPSRTRIFTTACRRPSL
jgi:hypothetical protein